MNQKNSKTKSNNEIINIDINQNQNQNQNKNPENFFIEVLKETEKNMNMISYFEKNNSPLIEFSDIQIKILIQKFANYKDKISLTIEQISQNNLLSIIKSNLLSLYENITIISDDILDISFIHPYIKNKSFLLELNNSIVFYFCKEGTELHIFLTNFDTFLLCLENINKLIALNKINSLEFIFKDEDLNCDKYFPYIEKNLLQENNIFSLTNLFLHNINNNFTKENIELLVNNICKNHKNLRILKLTGFEINDYNPNNNANNNEGDLNINSILNFNFELEKIKENNNTLKILSASLDKKILTNNSENNSIEKFYISNIRNLQMEIFAVEYLKIVRKNYLNNFNFFNKFKSQIRKYLLKFFPLKKFDARNEFSNKFLNYNNENVYDFLSDYSISIIEKFGFDKKTIGNFTLNEFLNKVFYK
jgi:hypothetical protein